MNSPSDYVGRLAPSPTGLLHLGHARTFWAAWKRARQQRGKLWLRNDDLDRSRCRTDFVEAMQEDLRWLGLDWDGEIITESQRLTRYQEALRQLHRAGRIYPCHRSRKDVAEAAGAPHEGGDNDEPVYPREWRPAPDAAPAPLAFEGVNWRFRVPDDQPLSFQDGFLGDCRAVSGVDFGDFLVWRKDGFPSYQLASVVDDRDLSVTEVVRGADLVRSTFRQQLLFAALASPSPRFFHCPLVRDEGGQRLAKRHDALSLRQLRAQGVAPQSLLDTFQRELPLP